jgi:23S rRNA (adenine2503-C2)-methyltransferase
MNYPLEHKPEELRNWFVEQDLPAYRAGQVRNWIFQRRAASFDEMTDLPAALRRRMAEEFTIFSARVVERLESADGTQKLLLELGDLHRVECVLLRDDKQHCAVCVSTQVGCAMGCAFCATGIDGVARNLSTGEILEQMLQLQRLLLPDERLSHVVVMGMGEPLLNLDALMPALAAATDSDGLGIGVRRITISTVGIPDAMRRLAREDCPYHLAVSLHAPDDQLRNEIVPANRGTGIAQIMSAADEYFELTGRRVTFEYVLLSGVNDRPDHARRLLELLRGRPALVNLIPYNPVKEFPFRTPSPAATARFVEILGQGGLNVNIRHRKGDRIAAACGQLRRGANAAEIRSR